MKIHPSAVVDSSAEIAADVEIGPLAIISGEAKIGKGCRIAGHAQILGDVIIGENCTVDAAAIIGGNPQALDFNPGTKSGVTIGAGNVVREHVTIHRSMVEGGRTQLGDRNFIMAGAHFGHDCVVGNSNTVANNCLFAGHVEVGDRAFFGGGSVFHQFIRVGDLVMTQGNSGFSQDLPPYIMGASINRIAGLNLVGLKRAGFSPAMRTEIKRAFRLLLRSGMNLSDAIAQSGEMEWSESAKHFINFFIKSNGRPICSKFQKENKVATKT